MKFRDRARVTTALRVVAIGAAALVVQGCKKPEPKPPAGGGAATLTEQAIVVRDMAGLEDDFAFGKTIGAILASAGVTDTPQARVDLVQTMINNFKLTEARNPVSGLKMPVENRPNESALVAADLLDPTKDTGLHPIGLFNRMDLAPRDWSDCGEHRIVYAFKDGAAKGRFFLIFEAKLPNPEPTKGMEGCKAVAQRWQAIGAAASNTERKPLLDELYFKGLQGFEPVVHYLNYGGFLGQVRANLFAKGSAPQSWQLREFRVLPAAPQVLVFSPGPVANNPLTELYGDSGPSDQATERARFQAAFKTTYAAALHDFDANAPATLSAADFREGVLNCVGAPILLRDDEFQSDSLGTQANPSPDDPAAKAGPTFKGTLTDWSSADGSRKVTVDETLNRAAAVTCGGCHEFAGNKPIGTANGAALQWPQGQAGGFMFVHISEKVEPSSTRHVLSDTLRTAFIPHRMKVLQSILDGKNPGEHCAIPATPASAQAVPAAAASPTRESARQAAERVLRPATAAATPSAAGGSPADAMRSLSERAHAADQQKPGAAIAFRRPH